MCRRTPAPVRVIAPRTLDRIVVRAAIVYVLALLGVGLVTGSPLAGFNFVTIMLILNVVESPKPFEMDAEGIRGGDTGDRMTWPYIERVEMADARRFGLHSRVVGRYGNVVTVHAELSAAGTDVHPAELVRREAERRGVPVIGRQPIRSLVRRTWGLALALAATLALTALANVSS